MVGQIFMGMNDKYYYHLLVLTYITYIQNSKVTYKNIQPSSTKV